MTEARANNEMKTVGDRGWVRWVVGSGLLFVAAVLGVLFYLLVPSYLEDAPSFADHGLTTLMSRNISLAPSSSRPYVGITYQELNPQAGDRPSLPASGAIVTSVVPSGPAAMAGLNTGDIILALDGQSVGKESPFLKLLFSRRSGDRVTLSIQRGQEHLTLNVSLGKR